MSCLFAAKTEDALTVGAVRQGAGPGRRVPRRSRRGMSIFGVVLGVAIAAAVALGLVSAYQGVLTNTRTQATLNTLLIMDAGIRRSYASLPEFEANLTSGLWSAVPSNAIQLRDGTRTIVTPWGGEIFAGGGDTPKNNGAGTASGNRFYITVLNLPEEACETIGSSFLNRSDVVGLDVEGAGATAFTQVKTAAQIQAFDAVSEIDAECDGGDDDKVAIVFRG